MVQLGGPHRQLVSLLAVEPAVHSGSHPVIMIMIMVVMIMMVMAIIMLGMIMIAMVMLMVMIMMGMMVLCILGVLYNVGAMYNIVWHFIAKQEQLGEHMHFLYFFFYKFSNSFYKKRAHYL